MFHIKVPETQGFQCYSLFLQKEIDFHSPNFCSTAFQRLATVSLTLSFFSYVPIFLLPHQGLPRKQMVAQQQALVGAVEQVFFFSYPYPCCQFHDQGLVLVRVGLLLQEGRCAILRVGFQVLVLVWQRNCCPQASSLPLQSISQSEIVSLNFKRPQNSTLFQVN